MTKTRWALAVCVLVALAAIASVLVIRQQSRPTDDCRVAADVIETWMSLSASLNAMVEAPDGDEATKAAQAEDAAVRDIRAKASQISSAGIRAYVFELADALAQIADAQRSTESSEPADTRYMDGSAAAMVAAAGLREQCPSISRDRR